MLRTAIASPVWRGEGSYLAEVEACASQPCDAEAGIYTETLARLYLKQGFVERALAIYRRLVQEQPEQCAAPRASAHLGAGTARREDLG